MNADAGTYRHRSLVPSQQGSRRARPGRLFSLLGQFLLVLSTLAAFNISYYGVDRIVEVLCFAALAGLTGMCFAARRTSHSTRRLIIYILAAVVAAATLWAAVFASRTGGAFLDSFLSGRWQAFWLVLPCILALHENGTKPRRLLLVVGASLFALLALLMFRQSTTDLQALASSSTEVTRIIRAPDALRNYYRLPDPQYAWAVLLIMILSVLLHSRFSNLPALVLLVAISPVVYLFYSRLSLLFIFVALFTAVVFVARLPRLVRWASICIFATAGLLLVSGSVDAALRIVSDDRSGSIRLQTISIVWAQFAANPLLGFGLDSAQGITYENLFGRTFFPSDVGYAGIAFGYGLVGLVYVFSVQFTLLRRALQRHRTMNRGLFRALSFGTVWSLFYFAIAGVTFRPLFASDGIVAFAVLAAMSQLLKNEPVSQEQT